MDPLWIRYGIALLVPGEYAVLHPAAMELAAETVRYLSKCGISEQAFRGDAKEIHD